MYEMLDFDEEGMGNADVDIDDSTAMHCLTDSVCMYMFVCTCIM